MDFNKFRGDPDRITLDSYADAARVISLHLQEFCDENLLYPQMIAVAARKAHEEIVKLRSLEVEDWQIICSVRYSLGRRSYQVSITCNWIISHWANIPADVKSIIQQDVEEAFKIEDLQHNNKKPGLQLYYLGDDCDRKCWEAVRDLWAKE